MRRCAKRRRARHAPCLAAVSVGAQPDDRAYRAACALGGRVRRDRTPGRAAADCTADALTGTLRALSADDTCTVCCCCGRAEGAARAAPARRARPPQGRRRHDDGIARRTADGCGGLCPLHGRGVPAPAARIRLRPSGPARDRRRAQSRHRTSGGAAAHARGCDRDALPQENARPRRAACREADILLAAAGTPGLITPACVHPEQIVLDAGVTALPDGTLLGDVAAEAAGTVAACTPVPGGIGA